MPEMRTLCALLELNEIPYSTENIDIFTDVGKKDYFSLNPGEQIPTIIKGFQTVIADAPHLYKYICKTENIDEKFYPTKEMNKDKKKIVDQILEMIQWNVRTNFNRLIKLKLQKILLDRRLVDVDPVKATSEFEFEHDIFQSVILHNLET
jgi:glutathione S-transferase